MRAEDRQIVSDQAVDYLETPGQRDYGLEELGLVGLQIQVLLEEVPHRELQKDLESMAKEDHTLHDEEGAVILAVQFPQPLDDAHYSKEPPEESGRPICIGFPGDATPILFMSLCFLNIVVVAKLLSAWRVMPSSNLHLLELYRFEKILSI